MTANERAFAGHSDSAARWFASQAHWWDDHYRNAVGDALQYLRDDGIAGQGKDLLDVGCGDGIISLGLLHQGGFASVTGMDIVAVDMDFLRDQAARHGVGSPDDARLRFVRSVPDEIPAPDASFDIATAWSVFEHVTDPGPLLAEVFRVLRPNGLFFIQVWPLWFSEHGSHLWPFFDETFVHLTRSPAEIREHLNSRIGDAGLADSMYDLYESCNRHTVDEIQVALRAAGFYLAKATLSGAGIHVPPQLQDVPLSKLAVDGFKLLAVKQA